MSVYIVESMSPIHRLCRLTELHFGDEKEAALPPSALAMPSLQFGIIHTGRRLIVSCNEVKWK
jgi:hypothetical protein